MKISKQICSRCIYDSEVPGITFDESGVCNYCHQVDDMEVQFGTGTEKGVESLREIIAQIKVDGRGKKYDCIIGVSGGTDSSYLLFKAVEWGLRPLAVHYDNTWNGAMATENIRKVTAHLDIDLYTYVVDNKEADDIFRSFLLAGVPEFDASTDIAFAQVLRSAAAKYGIRYVLEGHSFKEEGISPMGKNYFDGKYIQNIHQRFGKRKMKSYPNMTFLQFMKWVLVFRQKFIRPLWYVSFSKEEAQAFLQRECGWSYYGGHHLENRSSTFLHTVWLPQCFDIDFRNLTLAALVRSGKLERQAAMDIYSTPVEADPELTAYVKKRLDISDQKFEEIMAAPKHNFRDFKTYKKRFERLRPMFAVLAKANLVPMSFYLKYCFPIKGEQ